MAVRHHDCVPLPSGPAHLGTRPPRALLPHPVRAHGPGALPAHDKILGQAFSRQLHSRGCDRSGAGVPVWDGLEPVRPIRRRCLRCSAGDGGSSRLLRRVHVSWPMDLRLGPFAQADPSGHALGGRDRHLALRFLHHRRELLDAASGRCQAGERSSPARRHLGGPDQQHGARGVLAHPGRLAVSRRRVRAWDLVVPPVASPSRRDRHGWCRQARDRGLGPRHPRS
jgi:hypothetical protein